MACGTESASTGAFTAVYLAHMRQKLLLLMGLFGVMGLVAMYAVARGAYDIPISDVLRVLTGSADSTINVVITRIRLPRVVAPYSAAGGYLFRDYVFSRF